MRLSFALSNGFGSSGVSPANSTGRRRAWRKRRTNAAIREAAIQLAKLQDELRKGLAASAKKPMSDEEKARWTAKQEAIQKAAEKLSTPPGDESSAREKSETLTRLKEATEAVQRCPTAPAKAQAKAAEALKKLAERLPPREERMKKSLEQLQQLQREQESREREVQDKLKPFEKKKPNDVVQRELAEELEDDRKTRFAEKLAKLDAPGFEEQRDGTAESAERAAGDLREGLPQDIPASQADLKSRMNQLRTALEGGTPSDALVDELARKQNNLSDRLAKQPNDAAALAELQKLQREIADKLGSLNDPDGAERLHRAKRSAADAARQFQKADDVDELRKKAKDAAKDLDDLADHLSGVEGDRERVERLAKQRKERADWSKANASRPTPAKQPRCRANSNANCRT